MICKYQELTRLEIEQVDRENTIVLIPLGGKHYSRSVQFKQIR